MSFTAWRDLRDDVHGMAHGHGETFSCHFAELAEAPHVYVTYLMVMLPEKVQTSVCANIRITNRQSYTAQMQFHATSPRLRNVILISVRICLSIQAIV
jgi:hypothetical protein